MQRRRQEDLLPLHPRPASGVFRKLKSGKSAGEDEISNEMLKRLPEASEERLLDIFNRSWSTGYCPTIWRTALLIPLLKKGKSPSKPGSYRPVALTSCVAKTMEKLVADRLNELKAKDY
jgi:hypothetical protein